MVNRPTRVLTTNITRPKYECRVIVGADRHSPADAEMHGAKTPSRLGFLTVRYGAGIAHFLFPHRG